MQKGRTRGEGLVVPGEKTDNPQNEAIYENNLQRTQRSRGKVRVSGGPPLTFNLKRTRNNPPSRRAVPGAELHAAAGLVGPIGSEAYSKFVPSMEGKGGDPQG